MLKRRGLGSDEVSRVYEVGVFGGSLEPRNTVTIGMLPDIKLEKYPSSGTQQSQARR